MIKALHQIWMSLMIWGSESPCYVLKICIHQQYFGLSFCIVNIYGGDVRDDNYWCHNSLEEKELIVGKWIVAEKSGEASVAGRTRASSGTLATRKGWWPENSVPWSGDFGVSTAFEAFVFFLFYLKFALSAYSGSWIFFKLLSELGIGYGVVLWITRRK